MAKEENGKWITVKGTHVFIPDGKRPSEVLKSKFKLQGGSKESYNKKEAKLRDTENKLLSSWKGASAPINQRRAKSIEKQHADLRKQREAMEFGSTTPRPVREDLQKYFGKTETPNWRDKDIQPMQTKGLQNAIPQRTAPKGELSGMEATNALNKLEAGMPVMVKYGKDFEPKQAIYLGRNDDGRFAFYDGGGVTGRFDFGEQWLKDNPNVSFNFEDNDPIEWNRLNQELLGNKDNKPNWNKDTEDYMNIPQEERVKAYEEGKNWKDLVNEKRNIGNDESLYKKVDKYITDEEYNDISVAVGDDAIKVTSDRTGASAWIKDESEIPKALRSITGSNFYNNLDEAGKEKYDNYLKEGYSESDIENTLMYKTHEEQMREKGLYGPNSPEVKAYEEGIGWKDLVNIKNLEKSIIEDQKNGTTMERMKKIADQERYDRLADRYKEQGYNEEEISKLLGERPKTGISPEELNEKYGEPKRTTAQINKEYYQNRANTLEQRLDKIHNSLAKEHSDQEDRRLNEEREILLRELDDLYNTGRAKETSPKTNKETMNSTPKRLGSWKINENGKKEYYERELGDNEPGYWTKENGQRVFKENPNYKPVNKAKESAEKYKAENYEKKKQEMNNWLEKTKGIKGKDDTFEKAKPRRATKVEAESLFHKGGTKLKGYIQKEYGLKDVRNEFAVYQFMRGEQTIADLKDQLNLGGESKKTIDSIIQKRKDLRTKMNSRLSKKKK